MVCGQLTSILQRCREWGGFEEQDGMLLASAQKWQGSEILLRFPSVGATENAVLAAVYAPGITSIKNCAKEPEVVELCHSCRKKEPEFQGKVQTVSRSKA